MTDVVWDYDYIKYSVGSVAEKRSIVVTHKQSGNRMEFKTRTEFYGHYSKKAGGWLALQNEKRSTPWLVEDFTIEDKQVAEPVEYALNAVKTHVENVLHKLKVDNYYGYIGKGDSWRVGASTILKYKGDRANALRPIHLEAIEEYLKKFHAAEEVRDLEADDVCVIDCTANPELVLVAVDKDYRGCTLNLFNPDKMGEPEAIKGFGKLYIGSDKKVRGEGRIFKLHQVLSGDSSDGYFANSASDIKWGDKSSYAILSKCSDDRQAMQGMVEAYKKLYPSKKKVTGWRGDEIEIDWMYVMQENFTMAHMLRTPTDKVVVKDVLDKLKVEY